MAGRFLFQKLASRMSRSTSLLGAHASAPITRRASEDQGTMRPAGYLSTFHCTRAAFKRSSPPKFLPPVITSSTKPALVDYVRVKRHFSSSPSSKDTISWEQYRPAREPKWQAELEAKREAFYAEWKAEVAAFRRFVTMMIGYWTGIILVYISLGFESSHGGKGQSSSQCHKCCKCKTVVQHPDVQ